MAPRQEQMIHKLLDVLKERFYSYLQTLMVGEVMRSNQVENQGNFLILGKTKHYNKDGSFVNNFYKEKIMQTPSI